MIPQDADAPWLVSGRQVDFPSVRGLTPLYEFACVIQSVAGPVRFLAFQIFGSLKAVETFKILKK